MLKDLDEIKHIKQTHNDYCAVACLEMLTGLYGNEIVVELSMDGFEAPYHIEAVVRFLVRRSIFIESASMLTHSALPLDSVFLFACSASNNAFHFVVATTDEIGIKVLDLIELNIL